MSDPNRDYCRRMQWEYTAAMDNAFRNRDLNGGKYTKEGLRHLVEAAIAQRNLAAHTTGATRNAHNGEYARLTRVIKEEGVRLGVVQSQPTPATAAAPAPELRTQARGIPAPVKPPKDASKEEVGESFNLEDFRLEGGDLTLDDVHLDDALKEKLIDAIDPFDPIKLFPKATQGWTARPKSNFLFFGPPGTGKSHLCRAINGSMKRFYPGEQSVFYLIDGNKLVSKWRGSTGHRLDMIFQEAEKYAFSIICIDEFEQLCPDRTKLEDRESYTKNFLTLMEGVGGRTSAMVIACTNHPQLLDPAILSRLQNRLFIDYPDEEDIYRFFMDKKQYMDYLGKDSEEAGGTARALAKQAAQRRYSFRNLNTVVERFGDLVRRKTRMNYPKGNANLEHMCSLSCEEALAILEGVDSDFDAEQYSVYQDYIDRKGNV